MRKGWSGRHGFQFKAYRRHFSDTWVTAAARWTTREGILVRLEDGDGRVGYGEAAPIVEFGSETYASALSACLSVEEPVVPERLLPQLGSYPCVRFAVESALAMIERLDRWPTVEKPWPVCGLVNRLDNLAMVEEYLEFGYRALKFKIGTRPLAEERRLLDAVVNRAGEGIKLRVDANGGLDLRGALGWLEALAEYPSVEMLEQPLPKGEEREMRRLGEDFPTAIGLDESVCSLDDLKRWQDAQWPGLYVIKPLLSGSFEGMLEEARQGEADRFVFSSSLETQVGAWAALALAAESGARERPLGFGVERLFGDRNVGLALGPFLQPDGFPSRDDLDALWSRI